MPPPWVRRKIEMVMISYHCTFQEAARIIGARGGNKTAHKVVPKCLTAKPTIQIACPVSVRTFPSEIQLRFNLV